LILAAITPDNTPHGYNWTFAYPMLLFIVIAAVLYYLFGRPHRRVPPRPISASAAGRQRDAAAALAASAAGTGAAETAVAGTAAAGTGTAAAETASAGTGSAGETGAAETAGGNATAEHTGAQE
jgi:hypothetical protein